MIGGKCNIYLPACKAENRRRGRSVALVVLILLVDLAPNTTVAAGKQPSGWQSSTTVEPGAGPSNPVCQQIASNIAKRVAGIKGAQAAIANAAAAPPTSVKSAFEDMFGTRQPNAKTIELERRIKVERKAADDLNEMLRSSQCAQVDIEAALSNHKVQERAAPEAPKAMPDDLVRTPQRY